MSVAVQAKGEVLDVRRVGAYQVLSLTAPGIAEVTRPGHFVTLGIGGEESSMMLRRAFAIHQVQSRGVYGGTLDVVVIAPRGLAAWVSVAARVLAKSGRSTQTLDRYRCRLGHHG